MCVCVFEFSQVCSFHKTTGSDELQLSAVDAESCFTASRLLPFFPWGPRCVCSISFDFPTRNRTRWEISFFKKKCLNLVRKEFQHFYIYTTVAVDPHVFIANNLERLLNFPRKSFYHKDLMDVHCASQFDW